MPFTLTKVLNNEQRRILTRFLADIERLSNDMQANIDIISVGRENDTDYIIAQIEKYFKDEEQRVDMMSDSLTWQAYQLGMAQGLFETRDVIVWNLDEQAEHCDTCLEYAAIRYFTQDTLPGIPGSAPTICNAGCRCYLTES